MVMENERIWDYSGLRFILRKALNSILLITWDDSG